MTNKNAYIKLIEHTGKWLLGFTESEILTPMLELRFSEEEAEFLSAFPQRPNTLGQLSERFGTAPEKLLELMEPMIAKGFIITAGAGPDTRYYFATPITFLARMPGWKGVDDEWNRKIAPLINKYYTNNLGPDFMGHPTKGLRSIPIAKTIKDPKQVLPYEDILGIVDRLDFHAVSTCACRHRHSLDPDSKPCKFEKEVCLHFGGLGRYTVKYGMGREITRDETFDILKRAADAGLVHGISNSKDGIDTICNCCPCCCMMLEKINIGKPLRRGHQRSNYMLEINSDTCKTCGLCAKRCPLGALEIRSEAPQSNIQNNGPNVSGDKKFVYYDQEICIGCGVCAHKCPTQSMKLVRRETVEDIPANPADAGKRMVMERAIDLSKIF
jgi:Na+-translocating ferredoxin:NAD+ oxidoreductase subunit B